MKGSTKREERFKQLAASSIEENAPLPLRCSGCFNLFFLENTCISAVFVYRMCNTKLFQ